jgi:hypothetical protein
VIEVSVLNLLLGGGAIKPVELDLVTEIRLDDAKLQQEFVKALSAVAAARDQDSKPVAIRFTGARESAECASAMSLKRRFGKRAIGWY